MTLDPALVDTNVLVYSCFPESEHHEASRAVLDRAASGSESLCISSQVLAEFFAVVTSSRRVANVRDPDEALSTIEAFSDMPGMTVLLTPPDIVKRWSALARSLRVTGSRIFDLQLVATMQANGISRIYTFDRPHFERFNDIEVLMPS